MRTYLSLIVAPLLCVALTCAAQDKPATDAARADPKGFTIKPVVLDGKDKEGATVGLQYQLKKSWKWNWDSKDPSGDEFNPDATLSGLTVDVDGSGTIAASKERNPNKLLDLGVRGLYLGSTTLATFGAGASLRYETDQGFDDKQFVYGLTVVAAKYGLLMPNSSVILTAGYDRVDPRKDKSRKDLGASLDPYNRWSFEGYANIPLSGKLSSLELNYRHFQEISSPTSVQTAGLDRHRLGIIRLNFFNDFFIAYSKGSLPFDTAGDRTVTIGLSYKLM